MYHTIFFYRSERCCQFQLSYFCTILEESDVNTVMFAYNVDICLPHQAEPTKMQFIDSFDAGENMKQTTQKERLDIGKDFRVG